MALALALGGLLALGGWWWTIRGVGTVGASSGGTPSSQQAASPETVAPAPSAFDSPSAPAQSSPSSSVDTATSTTATDSPTYPPGATLLVLESFDQRQMSRSAAEARASTMTGVTVIDSSTVPGLNPGYWAVVSAKTYPSARSARADCASFGRKPSGACYPRKVDR